MVSGPHEGLSAELITNGDFEDHGDLNRSTWGTFETIAGWEATEGKIEIQEGSHGGTPDVANDQGFLEVDSHGGKDTNSTVETSVTVEEAGLHKLTFDYSPRGEDGADAAETSQVNVLVNGKVVDTISSETIGFEKQEYTLSLPAGENTISFQAAGTDDSLGGLIDNVSLKGPPAADARGPELVINGDFETHGDLNRSTWGTFETISGWEATEGNIEIQEGSHGGTPDVASDQGFLEVDSHGGTDTNSTVETRVIIEEAGTHELTFDYSPREKNGADTAETSQVNVLVNGEIVDTISSDTVGFEIQTFTLNLPAGETRSHSKL
jgi:archaellum component FlaF (FlaF/FlaG flagellin family)